MAIFLIILLFSPIALAQVPQEQPESIPKASTPPEDIIRINHEVVDRILRKYVDKKGLVDYKALKRDKEDLAALGRGFLRIVGSLAGATALKFALEKNSVATLSTLAAGVIAAVGISKTVELARNVPKAGDKKSRLSALGGAAVIAVATGGIVGTLELGAFQIDPEAWMIANVGLAAVAVTRPSQFIDLVEKTRNFIGGK